MVLSNFGKLVRSLIVLATLALSTQTPYAGEPASVQAERELKISAEYGFGQGMFGFAREEMWTQVRVTLAYTPDNMASTIDGELAVIPGDDEKEYVQPLRMGAGKKELRFHILPSSAHLAEDGYVFAIEVRNRGGSMLKKWFALPPRTALLEPNERLIVGIGRKSIAAIGTGFRDSQAKARQKQRQQVLALPKLNTVTTWTTPQALPFNPIAYEAVDAVIWADPQPGKLAPEQLNALADFVAAGGHLLLTPGDETRLSPEDIKILPGSFAGPRKVAIAANEKKLTLPADWNPLFGFDEKHDPTTIKCSGYYKGIFHVARLTPSGGKVLAKAGGDPLLIRGNYGMGRVTMLAVDMNSLPFAADSGARLRVLAKALDLPLTRGHLHCMYGYKGEDQRIIDRRWEYNLHVLPPSNIMTKYLSAASELKPLPLWLVVIYLFSFAMIAGPINHFYLKRKGKLAWTWVFFGASSLIFTTLAYGGALLAKGNRNFLRNVTVIDILPQGTERRINCTGLFASRAKNIKIEADNGEFVAGFGSLDLGRRRHYYYGPMSTQIMAAANRNISNHNFCVPENIPLKQWKMENIISQKIRRSAKSMFSAQMEKVTDELYKIKISNSYKNRRWQYALVTREKVILKNWDTPQPLEQTILFGKKPDTVKDLSGAMRGWLDRHYHWQDQNSIDIKNALRMSFPLAMQSYVRASVSIRNTGQGKNGYQAVTEPLDGDFGKIIEKIFPHNNVLEKSADLLGTWNKLKNAVEYIDQLKLDMTRFIAEGGAVLLAVGECTEEAPKIAGGDPEQVGYTIIRVAFTPDKIKKPIHYESENKKTDTYTPVMLAGTDKTGKGTK